LRNVVFHYEDSSSFALALKEGDQELPLPEGETVSDGEWVLAIFEVGKKMRATAAAARALQSEAGTPPVLAFERRDWERLVLFAEAGSMKMRAGAPAVPSAAPTKPSLTERLHVTSPSSSRMAAASPRAPAASPRTPPASPRAPAASAREPAASPRTASTPNFAHWRSSDPFTQGPHARVLVVDDDRDIREVVGAMLDAVGLTVESAMSAEEALERVRAASFDLLVLDWNLPGMTGVELCRLIRRDAKLATLPVLFLTAHASSHDVVEAFASGADDYVVKPFRAPELGARIFGLLRRARMSAAAS
jgi:two-component system phosphate regulon response regulator PhoB